MFRLYCAIFGHKRFFLIERDWKTYKPLHPELGTSGICLRCGYEWDDVDFNSMHLAG